MTFRLRLAQTVVGIALAAAVLGVPVVAVAAAVTSAPSNVVVWDGGTYHDI